MRTMYDSNNPADIPADAQMVGGYVDGSWGPDWQQRGSDYGWDDAGWARFPNAVKVRIANLASTEDGHVLDVEQGDATPDEAPGWAKMRRAAGVDPTCYVNMSNWQATRDAFAAAGEPEPHWWLALYDNVQSIPVGAVAKQYANEAILGFHADASAVADVWPGVDKEVTVDSRIPQFAGQSVTNVNLVVGEVQQISGTWNYADHGGDRFIIAKVVGYEPGTRFVVLYPPADPDADPTIVTDAQPALFVVATRAAT